MKVPQKLCATMYINRSSQCGKSIEIVEIKVNRRNTPPHAKVLSARSAYVVMIGVMMIMMRNMYRGFYEV